MHKKLMGTSDHLFPPGQRASLFVLMTLELENQKMFPMKAHLCHIKEQAGNMDLKFSNKDCLFFMQVTEEHPLSIIRSTVG
jgi:hypothetical protein